MELITAPYFLISGIVAFALTSLIYFFLTERENTTYSEPELIQLESNEGVDKFEKTTKQKSDDVLEQFDELELTQKIYQLLVIEEIYLQHGLTVGEFAKKLGVQARIVTQILDNLYGHSFKELTNMYRIEYAKERIEEGFLDSYTLEALGQEAGFSSRTTFFNVFKKEIGICPSEYWKKYLAQAA
ncbi:MAG: helix-turn-helix domain-containing protein [Algoriphagus sp.]|nr:helix-turn-helix domain-containing protein [Algoriphagus sp.]